MNASASCHEIAGCPGLYVDAFRGKYLLRTQDPDNAFVLTHYHGDHYGSLPKERKFQGPALIHCTPVTAALLRDVHEVPEMFIVEHPYGESWNFRPKGWLKTRDRHQRGDGSTKITFYDANHCPGATIVLVECPDGKVHVHTGDMRYHEKFTSYPLLRKAALNRTIDTVLLDTTYANPKHDFIPQEAAVHSIASQVQELLSPENNSDNKTLVLLSCYSVGKEKVLWEASTRANQLVYVSERKLRMLHCIQGHEESVSSQIVHRTTLDPERSDMHVIPMGMAGEMWPFFQPNYRACVDYARALTKPYEKVVAFIPTGWADATNWNKKNAVSRKKIQGLDVEIRLISYSEHSAFSELQAFVQFLQPRKIIPTVFKDANDMRRIEARFPIDSGRAKQHFFSSMAKTKEAVTPSPVNDERKCAPTNPNSDRKRKLSGYQNDQEIESLQTMGFGVDDARAALAASKGDVELAIETLLENPKESIREPQCIQFSSLPTSVSNQSPLKGQQPTIMKFFTRKDS